MEKIGGEFHQGDHILGVFHEENEIENGLNFLKDGFDHNEAVMLITDQIHKLVLIELIKQKFNLDDLKSYEDNKEIILQSTKEWCFPSGKVETKRIMTQFNDWVKISTENDKDGLRAFVDTSAFFKHGLGDKLVKFECELEKKFEIPFTTVCAYSYEDLKSIGKAKFSELKEHHNAVWMAK